MAWVPGGEFQMGSDSKHGAGQRAPRARGTRARLLDGRHHVTNAEFRKFVEATGYVTTAEKKPDWETLKVQLPPGTPRPPDSALVAGAMVFVGTDRPVSLEDYSRWWRYVPGANWRHPTGPASNIDGQRRSSGRAGFVRGCAGLREMGRQAPADRSRVGIRRARRARRKPPTRGATTSRRMASRWRTSGKASRKSRFRWYRRRRAARSARARVGSFPANGYGLSDMTGNAWQWVADWYRADQFRREASNGSVIDNPRGPAEAWDPADPGVPVEAPKRVTRGGSFLCNEDYCLSYRPSARRGTDPYNSMSHLGFRLVMDKDTWDKTHGRSQVAAADVPAR